MILPKVQSATFDTFCEQINREENWLGPALERMEIEQPLIFEIFREMSANYIDRGSDDEAVAFNVGAALMYKMLANQQEVNNLEEGMAV